MKVLVLNTKKKKKKKKKERKKKKKTKEQGKTELRKQFCAYSALVPDLGTEIQLLQKKKKY